MENLKLEKRNTLDIRVISNIFVGINMVDSLQAVVFYTGYE